MGVAVKSMFCALTTVYTSSVAPARGKSAKRLDIYACRVRFAPRRDRTRLPAPGHDGCERKQRQGRAGRPARDVALARETACGCDFPCSRRRLRSDERAQIR